MHNKLSDLYCLNVSVCFSGLFDEHKGLKNGIFVTSD